MGCILQRRLEDSPESHVESWSSLRLLRRAMGKERHERRSSWRSRRTVRNFGHEHCRYVATRAPRRFAYGPSAHRQEFQSSGCALLSQRLEQHWSRPWLELVIALGRKGQDRRARRIWP